MSRHARTVVFLHAIREVLWPRMGWRRLMRYLGYRIVRMPGTPYGIAAGFACGAAISFTPFIGFHFVLSAALAWLVGGSIVASAFGTAVGNPWTFPVIWISTYRLGQAMLEQVGIGTEIDGLSFEVLLEDPGEIFLPMLVGGTALGFLAWFIFFLLLRHAVAAYHAGRGRRPRPKSYGKKEMKV